MTILSGFVVHKGRQPKWIGCGTEDELHALHVQMQDDAVEDDRLYPGDLETRPATDAEIKRFQAETAAP